MAAAVIVAAIAPAGASSLPSRPAPGGFQTVDVSGGGRILEAVPAGARTSAQAIRAGVRLTAGYFDGPPTILSILRSADGRVTMAHFAATLRNQNVGGLLVAVFDGSRQRIAFLFDRTQDVGASMNGMIATLERPSGGSGGAATQLRPMVSPDRSVLAALPADWNTKQFGNGELIAVGPDSAEVDQEVSFSLIDPRSSLMNSGAMRIAYAGSPAQILTQVVGMLARSQGKSSSVRFQTAGAVSSAGGGLSVQHVAGTNTIDGVTRRFEGEIAVSQPGNYGGYSLDIKMISAPAAAYARDLPTMVAIYNSYRVDAQREAQITSEYVQFTQQQAARGAAQMAAVRAQNTATFNASMQNAAQVQDSIDRSTAGTVRYLSDTTVIAGPNGGHVTVGDSYADAVVRANPQQFHIVPMSDYRKGVDF